MPLLPVLKGSFTAGELSPLVRGRPDVDRYQLGASELENWQVLTQGPVRTRPGMRFVAEAKFTNLLTLVHAFEASGEAAYILEIGHEYIRFYRDDGRIDDPPGTPVEVVTPYQSTDLRLLRTAQSNDVMILAHPDYAPRRLSRTSDTTWVLSLVPFDPPPLFAAGLTPTQSLTLSALTGTITLTASSPVFFESDLQRQVTSGAGRALITGFTSTTVVTAMVLDAFASTSIAGGDWVLTGSPVADLRTDTQGPVGAQVALSLEGEGTAPNLVLNGDFSTGDLTNWTDLSGAVVSTGTHDGSNDFDNLVDSTADFLSDGVQPTHIVTNTTDGCIGQVANASATIVVIASPGMVGGTEGDFDTGDAYTIRQTGSATVSGGSAVLRAGSAGIGWIQQSIATTVGQSYQVEFVVSGAPMAAQVGSLTTQSDVVPEASYPVGEQSFSFIATSASSFLQFRNNQNNAAGVGAVSMTLFTLRGFRTADIGNYVVVHNGLIKILSGIDSAHVIGLILKVLESDAVAPAGSWSIQSPAWSDALGWPSAVILYEGCLYFAGTFRFPQTIWGSAVDDFFNFAAGTTDRDAKSFSIVDSGGNITLNRIQWLMPSENMLVGTTHAEYRLIGSGDDPLTPRLLPRVRVQSTFGSDQVQPLKVGAALLFSQRRGSKLREMVFDDTTNSTFVARDITVLASHLFETARALELAYQQEPVSTVWVVRSDGVLLGLTYDLSERVSGWFRVITQGSVESVATIPSPDRNAHEVWLSVRRTLGGNIVRTIERFDPYASMPLPVPWTDPVTNEVFTAWEGLTLDCGFLYSGAASATLTGLSVLDNTSVMVVGDGAVLGPFTVTGGQITLPVPVATAFIGLPYTCRGATLPPDFPQQGATMQRSKKRWVELTGRVVDTGCLVLNGERLPFRLASHPMNQGTPLFTGDRKVQPLGWDVTGQITFVVDQPLPCTLVGLICLLDVEVPR